jgi:RNA-directed DNA polymerase
MNEIMDFTFLKSEEATSAGPFNSLCLLADMDIPEHLDDSYYFRHVIPRSDGSKRILYEPKPVLMEVQRQIMNFLYQVEKRKSYFNSTKRLEWMYRLSPCSTAYRPGFSVVKNANFHIGNEVVMKVDIEDFFGTIQVSAMQEMWMHLLQIRERYLVEIGILKDEMSVEEKATVRLSLTKKIISVTSLNGALPQGSPSSGVLANYYLLRFDRKFLNFCVRNRLNYSRYSDDMTISGAEVDLQPGRILHYLNILLKKQGLKLKKSKTQLIRQHNRQTVTGIVVNEKRSAGREKKRAIRQEMYFLKKFGEDHVAKLGGSSHAYLSELSGKVNWVLQVRRSDDEFKRYRAELIIISRFVRKGKSIMQAVGYIQGLHEKVEQLKKTEKISVGGVEWKLLDEHSVEDSDKGIFTFTRRAKSRAYFTERAALDLPDLKHGWRLPTEKEFSDYFTETCYEDRALLGLIAPCDPRYNGIVDMKGFRYFNRVGVYWTADLAYLPGEELGRHRLGRKVVCVYAKNWKSSLKLNNQTIRKMGLNSDVRIVNTAVPLTKKSFSLAGAITLDDLLKDKGMAAGSCSVRLVRDLSQTDQTNYHVNKSFWNSVTATRHSVSLEQMKLKELPAFALSEWKSSSLFLANNEIHEFDMQNCAPLKRIDLQNNRLSSFDFSKVPNGLKHLLLKGNPEINTSDLPWKELTGTLHELSLDSYPEELKSRFLPEIYLDALQGERWTEVSSDQELMHLIATGEKVSHLLVRFKVGAGTIDPSGLFEKLNQIGPLHLFVLFEPLDDEMNLLLQELKIQGEFAESKLTAIVEFLKQKNWRINADYAWLRLGYTFNPDQLKSSLIRNFIIDFSWLPNLKFSGNFEIKPDSYHLLHPGIHPFQLPSTSEVFHRPTVLIKVLADRVDELDPGSMLIHYPLPRTGDKALLKNIHVLLPMNQEHVAEFVLIQSGKGKKMSETGRVTSFFPRSSRLKEILRDSWRSENKNAELRMSKSVSSFPLLGLSLRYDVFRLNLPFESVYKSGRLNTNKSYHNRMKEQGIHFADWTKPELSDQIHSDKQTVMNKENQLSELKIYPVNNSAHKNFIMDWNKKEEPFKPYLVRKGIFIHPSIVYEKEKREIIHLIRKGEFNPKNLPLKYRKDRELMLELIGFNPYAMVFAHKGLKEDISFILYAMKISLRTLVFLSRDLYKNRNRTNAALPIVLEELMRRLEPHEFNFIVNKLGTKINVTSDEIRQFFFEQLNYFSDDSMISFEKEISNQFFSNRAGLITPIRTYFIREAEKRGFFSKNGYFNSLEHAIKNKAQVVFLDISFGKKLLDLSSLSQFPNLKILKISLRGINDTLPVLPKLEEFYIDGSQTFWTYHNAEDLVKLMPRLKKLYSRDNNIDFGSQLEAILSTHPVIEYINVRPYYPYQKEIIEKLLENHRSKGRAIEIPLDEFNESDDMPF